MKIRHWARIQTGRGVVGGYHATDGWKGKAPCGLCGKVVVRGMGRWWESMGYKA